MQIYDLHCHSHCSDGILSPAELVSRAKAQNVEVLALTDHDSIDGVGEARTIAAQEGITLVSGVEFSCLWQGRGIHVVGLDFDTDNPVIKEALAVQRSAREQRAETISNRLFKLGIVGALEGAKHYAKGGAIGRPHFAQYLIDRGVVANMNQAFSKYLGAGKPGDVKQVWPEIQAAIGWILAAGGVAVLAHPAKYDMTRTKLCSLVSEFKAAGGQGIELVCGKQQPHVTSNLVKIAKQYELYGSCGSDFHVPGQHWQELGQFGVYPETIAPVWTLFAGSDVKSSTDKTLRT